MSGRIPVVAPTQYVTGGLPFCPECGSFSHVRRGSITVKHQSKKKTREIKANESVPAGYIRDCANYICQSCNHSWSVKY